jgi:hypothetical protein
MDMMTKVYAVLSWLISIADKSSYADGALDFDVMSTQINVHCTTSTADAVYARVFNVRHP